MRRSKAWSLVARRSKLLITKSKITITLIAVILRLHLSTFILWTLIPALTNILVTVLPTTIVFSTSGLCSESTELSKSTTLLTNETLSAKWLTPKLKGLLNALDIHTVFTCTLRIFRKLTRPWWFDTKGRKGSMCTKKLRLTTTVDLSWGLFLPCIQIILLLPVNTT